MTTLTPSGSFYITPALLTQAPTGVDWASIPPGSVRSGVTPQQNAAELANICARATSEVDRVCCQPLQASTDTLPLYGPGVRVGVDPACRRPTDLILKRWPVLEVTSIQVAPNRLPWVLTTVPSAEYQVKYPVVGIYGSSAPASAGEGGQAVLLNPGWIRTDRGRDGYAVLVQYVNGWPHTALTASAAGGESEIEVDDCTGWTITAPFPGAPTGATGTIYDAGAQEVIHVAATSATSGPGTLTLSAPLACEHQAGVLVSTLPQSVTWAAILFAVDIAMERGATTTTIPDIPGRAVAQAAGVDGKASTPSGWAECILRGTFDRII